MVQSRKTIRRSMESHVHSSVYEELQSDDWFIIDWIVFTYLQKLGVFPWRWGWRHQMETFSALLALCAGNSPVTGEFPLQRPVTQRFMFSDLRLNKRLSAQSWGWWFETPLCSLWRHCNPNQMNVERTGLWNNMACLLTSLVPLMKAVQLCFKKALLTTKYYWLTVFVLCRINIFQVEVQDQLT